MLGFIKVVFTICLLADHSNCRQVTSGISFMDEDYGLGMCVGPMAQQIANERKLYKPEIEFVAKSACTMGNRDPEPSGKGKQA